MNTNQTGKVKPEEVTIPPRVLSMTDEELDILEFRDYLFSLPSESLWDIVLHIDPELYPRRIETVRREIARRRLFFISPYTSFELRLRVVFGASVALMLLTAALRAIGLFSIHLDPGEHLSWFFDLAVGGPEAARVVFPVARIVAIGGSAVTAGGIGIAAWHVARRRMRPDVLVMGLLAAFALWVISRFV